MFLMKAKCTNRLQSKLLSSNPPELINEHRRLIMQDTFRARLKQDPTVEVTLCTAKHSELHGKKNKKIDNKKN